MWQLFSKIDCANLSLYSLAPGVFLFPEINSTAGHQADGVEELQNKLLPSASSPERSGVGNLPCPVSVLSLAAAVQIFTRCQVSHWEELPERAQTLYANICAIVIHICWNLSHIFFC